MDYYDGNTVTALWNYAQHYSLNDNSFGTQFGPSTPGALNLISGTTYGATAVNSKTGKKVNPPDAPTSVGSPNTKGVGTDVQRPDPAYDDCSDSNHTSTGNLAALQGKNIGDLLNSKGITWGWFQGGFAPTGTANGYAVCGAIARQRGRHLAPRTTARTTTRSPTTSRRRTRSTCRPSSPRLIGETDQANHNYDLSAFGTALKDGQPARGELPEGGGVPGRPRRLLGPAGRADVPDHRDQRDRAVPGVERARRSSSPTTTPTAGTTTVSSPIVERLARRTLGRADLHATPTSTWPTATDRCGYGPRLPLLVISPYSKRNYVDNTLTDQSSITKFIEDNWRLGRIGDGSDDAIAGSLNNMFNFEQWPDTKPLILDTKTGAVVSDHHGH